MTAHQLGACPFCKHTNIHLNELRRGNYRRKGDNYQAVCMKCKARGPLIKDIPEKAADAWNALTKAEGTANG